MTSPTPWAGRLSITTQPTLQGIVLTERAGCNDLGDRTREEDIDTYLRIIVQLRRIHELLTRMWKNNIMSGFATDLSGEECWKDEKVCMWAFGHTYLYRRWGHFIEQSIPRSFPSCPNLSLFFLVLDKLPLVLILSIPVRSTDILTLNDVARRKFFNYLTIFEAEPHKRIVKSRCVFQDL